MLLLDEYLLLKKNVLVALFVNRFWKTRLTYFDKVRN